MGLRVPLRARREARCTRVAGRRVAAGGGKAVGSVWQLRLSEAFPDRNMQPLQQNCGPFVKVGRGYAGDLVTIFISSVS